MTKEELMGKLSKVLGSYIEKNDDFEDIETIISSNASELMRSLHPTFSVRSFNEKTNEINITIYISGEEIDRKSLSLDKLTNDQLKAILSIVKGK